jgi:hypothetical protein
MALKNILISIGVPPNQSNFVIKGNLQTYLDISAVTGTNFHAVEIQDVGWDLVINVITPETALLESGSFGRINLREKSGKKVRSAIVPIAVIPTIKAAVEGANGLSVDGILCGSVSQGLRRRAR